MPRIDPPFPSFTFVATKMAENRLPAYRHTHLGRYHPYARVVRQRLEDAFMVRRSSYSSLYTLEDAPHLRRSTLPPLRPLQHLRW